MNAGYFLIQLASEKDKTGVYKQIGEKSQDEPADEVAADILEASKHIAKDQLGGTDDGGFSPFSIDIEPKHGSSDFARDIAMQKIKARFDVARMASEKLGVWIHSTARRPWTTAVPFIHHSLPTPSLS
ncbi:MAG: hypothetical protein Q9180_003993 [Flavoplaca navasiana]